MYAGVVLDPAHQRRAAGVLPGQAEEVEAGDVGDAAAMAQAPVLVEDGQLDPRVVGAEAGRPDDGVDLELAPSSKRTVARRRRRRAAWSSTP